MSSLMMFDRSAMLASAGAMPTSTAAGLPAAPSVSPMMGNMCMLPRCQMKFEKCKGGMKIVCNCEDEVACAMLQNMCKMLADGLCSCCCLMNGRAICQCNLAMCKCECAATKDGVCITCTSGDKACCEMIQACCDCLCQCMEAGCMCCVSMGGMPVCCGCC